MIRIVTDEQYLKLLKTENQNLGNLVRELQEQLATQAAVIDEMREALVMCEGMVDELRDYPITHDDIIHALSLPSDHKAVLQQWLDKTLGGPVVFAYCENGEDVCFGHPQGYYPEDALPLYLKPTF